MQKLMAKRGIFRGPLWGCGTIRAQHALRQSFLFTDTHAMLQPEIKIPSVAKLFDASGKLTDETTRQYIQKFLEAFLRWIARFSG
jgi:chromate reductase, NAD(P)H dehydrogenase (quinone)